MYMKTIMDIDKEYKDKIETECFNGDYEHDHLEGDKIVIELLKELGYVETAETYMKVGKYYA